MASVPVPASTTSQIDRNARKICLSPASPSAVERPSNVARPSTDSTKLATVYGRHAGARWASSSSAISVATSSGPGSGSGSRRRTRAPGWQMVRLRCSDPNGRTMSTASSRPERNLALELVRVTEAAALSCARMIGRGDKEGADQAAVDAMRAVLDSVSMDGVVVIGEGEKDKAPMLYNGEQVGDGSPPPVDVAVDPLEGTRLTALGMPSALAVIALAERGT